MRPLDRIFLNVPLVLMCTMHLFSVGDHDSRAHLALTGLVRDTKKVWLPLLVFNVELQPGCAKGEWAAASQLLPWRTEQSSNSEKIWLIFKLIIGTISEP